MTLPDGVPTVTVTTSEPLALPDGTPFVGYLTFTGPDVVTVAGQHVVIGGAARADLVDGSFTVDLVPNNIDGMSPIGWTYRVDAVFTNAPGWTRYISVPTSDDPVQLADILIPDPAQGEFVVVTGPRGPQGEPGVQGVDGAPGAKGDTGAAGPQPALGAAGAGSAIALKSTDPTTTNSRPPKGTTDVSGTAAVGLGLAGSGDALGEWTGASGVGGWIFNIRAYGAKGDGQVVTDGVMTSGSAILACTTSTPFTSADIGKAVLVKGAAATGVTTLVTAISGFTNTGHITLAATAATAVSGALVMWATDDTAAVQAAITAAATYAQTHAGVARVFVPPSAGFYGIAGPLISGGTTKGNAQLTLPIIASTARKVILTIEGAVTGAGVQHWEQTVPQYAGALVSFGVHASTSAQITSINSAGNSCVIGGPSQPSGYGTSAAQYSNVLISLRNLSILTTYSAYGLTYTAWDFSGIANASVEHVGYGTTGTVAGGDYASYGGFATGLSIGALMPANGNNDMCLIRDVTCHGGYTYGFFATEHSVVSRMVLLYCWSAFCVVGLYYGSGGATHAIYADQLSIEACSNLVYIVGLGSGGVGPIVHITQLDTETSTPVLDDNNGGTGLACALGEIRLTGLYTAANIAATHPTGIRVIDGQKAQPIAAITADHTATIAEDTFLVDATAGNVTVTLPSAANTALRYTVKKADASAHTVTIAAAAGQTIDGAASIAITARWTALTLIPSGGGWYVV
jgi:hypothetical protein